MKAVDFMKQHIIDFLIVLAVLVYILYGLLTVDKTGKTVQQILQDGLMALIFSFTLSQLFSLNGMAAGDKDERVIATNRLHGEIMEKVTPYIEGLAQFCEDETRNEIKIRQISILAAAGLSYDRFINHEYKYEELSKVQKRAYRKALRVKVARLSVTSLATKEEAHHSTDMPSKRKFIVKSATVGLVQKLVIAIVCGYYAVRIVENPNWSYILWTAIQSVLFLMLGAMAYYKAYMFVTENLREGTIKKINYLEKYYNMRDKYVTPKVVSAPVNNINYAPKESEYGIIG